jgi:hypothetical protein
VVTVLSLLPACLPSPDLTPVAPTSVTIPPTAPTIWFPPTNTATLIPTLGATATPEGKPGVGDLTFSDDFNLPSSWSTRVADEGSAIVENNRLTLAVRQPGVAMLSLRSGLLLKDFYVEVLAHTSLCRDRDEYGLLFRAVSAANYYRFVLNCRGAVRVDRVNGREVVIIQPAALSGDAPPGAPGDVKIGVWAVGKEMRFFLNDHFQFTVRDPAYTIGTVGVYARSNGDTAVTVSFSNLSARKVLYISPTPSIAPSRTPVPTSTLKPTP